MFPRLAPPGCVSEGRLQAGDDGTRIAGEQRGGGRQVRTCMMSLWTWPHSCCRTLGCWSPCWRIAAAGSVGLTLRGELLDLLAVLEELVPYPRAIDAGHSQL